MVTSNGGNKPSKEVTSVAIQLTDTCVSSSDFQTGTPKEKGVLMAQPTDSGDTDGMELKEQMVDI